MKQMALDTTTKETRTTTELSEIEGKERAARQTGGSFLIPLPLPALCNQLSAALYQLQAARLPLPTAARHLLT